MRHGRRTTGLVATAALCAAAGLAVAEPLAKEDCDRHKTEHEALINGGIKDDLAKGPEWGKANLRADRLKSIERYIALEEQLNFRCGYASAKLNLPTEDAPPAAAPDAKATKPAAKARPKPKPQAKPEQATAAPPADAAPAPAPPKAKPKPKPKADDAYRPSSTDAGGNPFAKQAAPKE